jgi:protein Tob/BTG
MIVEVLYAVDFICGLLRHHNDNASDDEKSGFKSGSSTSSGSADRVSTFRRKLDDRLRAHYRGHWHPKAPERGSAYRCIRIVRRQIDPLIAGAGREAGISERELLAKLPADLTLWIDPDEVCVRFGEEGSVGVIYDGVAKNAGSDSDPDDSAMSTDYSSEADSDRASPETVLPTAADLRPVVMPTN